MIQLPDIDLPAATRSSLKKLQDKIDTVADYAEKVALAKRRFAQYNKASNATFTQVRAALARMCSGMRRCAYCEDSCADEVEHIKPKDLYPEVVFVWENYLYACGPCNGPKNNQFAIFSHTDGLKKDVTRRSGDAIVPPESGDPVLIDPRRENPLDFMELDLIDTFFFLPLDDDGSSIRIRAEYTIDVLRLNERDFLPQARANAFGGYIARLSHYRTKRDEHVSELELNRIINGIKSTDHPTVWQEMKRKHSLIPELRELFSAAPEALEW